MALKLSHLDGTNGFRINRSLFNDTLTIFCAGDVNGDEIDDLILGHPEFFVSDIYCTGESYVVFG